MSFNGQHCKLLAALNIRYKVIMTDYTSELLLTLNLKHSVEIDIFIQHIKKPCSSNNMYESDFARIHREIKAIIDAQVEQDVDEPYCYSLLVEAFDCYIYKMTLEYDGEYRSKLITQFRKILDAQDIMLLLPAINGLNYLNDELSSLRTKLVNIRKKKKSEGALKGLYRRPSYTKAVKTK